MQVDRLIRVVIAAAALLAAAVAANDAAARRAPGPADTVFRNSSVYTVDKHDRVREALAVRDGVIVFVGNDRSAERFIGDDTEVIDLGGRMMMPGRGDGHIHSITQLGTVQTRCDMNFELLTVNQFQARIQACLDDPAFGVEPTDRLSVRNWEATAMRPFGTPITKALLDVLDTERPIIVSTPDAHSSLVNTRALELAGITAATPDPNNGRIVRDANGEPTGQLLDGAQSLVFDVGTTPATPPRPPELERARLGIAELSRTGITSIMIPGTDVERAQTYRDLRNQGCLDARVHVMISVSQDLAREPEQAVAMVDAARSAIEVPDEIPRQVCDWRPVANDCGPRRIPEPAVSVDGVKLPAQGGSWLDGVLQWPEQSAAVLEPYLENVGTPEEPSWVPRTDEFARGELHLEEPELPGRPRER